MLVNWIDCCCLPPTGHGSFGCSGCISDTINGAKCVRDLYDLASGEAAFAGAVVLPAVW